MPCDQQTYFLRGTWFESITKSIEREFHGVPHLVAEVSVADHSFHIEIDVSTLGSVHTQGKPHGIRTTLWDTFGIICFLRTNKDR